MLTTVREQLIHQRMLPLNKYEKHLVLIIAVTIIGFCSAQRASCKIKFNYDNLCASSVKKDTLYVQDPSLHRFDGTWEYSDNNTTFRIALKTEKVYNNIYYNYIDFVSGYHLYIKDKKTIQNSIGVKKTLAYGSYLNMEVSKNILEFIFNDLGRPRSADAIVELLPDGRLKWKLKNRGEGFRFVVKGAPEPEKEDRNFYVPKDLILTKIK